MLPGPPSDDGPVRRSIEEFWHDIYGEPEEPQTFLGISSGKRPAGERGKANKGRYPGGDLKTQYFRWPEEAEAAATYALEESRQGRNVYHCAHLLKERRRQKENAAAVSCLWADGDEAGIPEGIDDPSLTVEPSPGRYHYYWGLARRIPPERAEELNKRLAYEIGADKGGWDLTQLLRVPGTSNYDYAGVHDEVPIVRVVA